MVSSRRIVNARTKEDVVDRFFHHFESLLPQGSVKNIPLEEDKLDFMCNVVESYTCLPHAEEEEIADERPTTLQRDNSLIEACNSVHAKFLKQKKASKSSQSTSLQRDIKPLGQKGDLLDVVFDSAETYACGAEATGDLEPGEGFTTTTHRGSTGVRPRVDFSKVEEADEVLHLYYRPN